MLVVLVSALAVYSLSIIVYRFYLSPVSKFPGPRVAALTFWYEFYYDVVLKGQYTRKIQQLHEQYGMYIVRLIYRVTEMIKVRLSA